jgi:hypothetical protein
MRFDEGEGGSPPSLLYRLSLGIHHIEQILIFMDIYDDIG